ncbi:lantibiotic dehydratase [Glycomyces salinus]|uniref:lantibiotic dehydratase n=1 Tax=Glycomyces salinus TaxID=980294 RepID=UPI0018EBBE51|nr:lantibiotic dehydratase [Glycomyces salinus]
MTFTATSGLIARLSTTTDRLPDLPDFAAPTAEVRDWIKSRWADAGFAAAVALASPHLADAVASILTGHGSDRDVRRAATSLARYLLRHHSRATPFGTWAACLPAVIGPAAALDLPAEPTIVHHTSYARLVTETDAPARPSEPNFGQITVCRNPLALERPTCIILPWAPADTIETEPRTITVRRTKPLSTLWDTASEPVTIEALTEAISTVHPALAVDACHRVIAGLIEHRLLLTDTATSITALPVRTPPSQTSTIINAAYDAALTVPEPVARAAARAADILLRLSPHPKGDPAWQDYHRRWLDHYGPGHVVSLPRLLDPAAGLGPPAGYRGSAFPAPAPAFGDRDRRLLALAEHTLLAGETTLHLTDALIDELSQSDATAPPCAEVTLTIAADAPGAVDRGDFTATVRTASPSLFHSTGRHLTYLDPTATTAARDALTDLQRAHPGWRWAQTSPVPLADDLTDLAAHPRLLDTLIPIGEHPADPTALRPDRIGITGDAERLWAVNLDTGQPVRTLTCNAIEPVKYQHPATRFLTELTVAFDTALGPWTWGAANALPVLPRVQYGQLILAPARWRLDAALLDPNQDFTDWDRDLAAWCDRTGLAWFVAVGATDVRFTLDLDRPEHRQMLHVEQRRGGTVELREAPEPGSTDWIASRSHEINVPLIAPPARPAPAPRRPGASPATAQPPGTGRWWSLHLFTDTAEAERIITRHLPAFTDQLSTGGAWYLHYPDPAPHLRLRLPRTGRGDLEAIAEWTSFLIEAGLISDCHLATYRPETHRYGHGPLLAVAEDLFVADSTCAAAILSSTEPSSIDRDAGSAVNLLHLAESLADTPETAWAWLIDHIDQHAPETITATHAARHRARHTRNRARHRYAAPTNNDTPWSDRHAVAANYRQQHQNTEQPPDLSEVTAALLHLVCNRLFGPDPETERRLLYYTRSLALANHHQQGHPR